MWDVLITIGNIIIIPAMLSAAVDKRAYIPRRTSGLSLIGIAAVIAGLVGAGLVFSPIVIAIIGLIWLYIFLFRHEPYVAPASEVTSDAAPLSSEA